LPEDVQDHATKMVSSLNKFPCIERLHHLKLPTLTYQRKRVDNIFTKKILSKNTLPVSLHSPCILVQENIQWRSLCIIPWVDIEVISSAKESSICGINCLRKQFLQLQLTLSSPILIRNGSARSSFTVGKLQSLDQQPQSTPNNIFFITGASQVWKILISLQAVI